jgi:hypothetical protein
MTIHLTIERDRMSEFHKSSRYRCKLSANGRRIFMSTRNAGSVTLAKRDAEELFDQPIPWREVDHPEIRSEADIKL